MFRPLLSLLVLALVATSFTGCASWTRRKAAAYSGPEPRTIALAITVNGVLQPTPQQYAAIQAQAVRQFRRLGYIVVTDLSLAEAIARIDFVPDANDPENSGRATLLGYRRNPFYASASSAPPLRYPTSFSYAGSFAHTHWPTLNRFGYGYYGYGDSYYDGYSYSSPTLNPVQPTVVTNSKPAPPPFRPDSPLCPPEHQRVRPQPPNFVADSNPPGTHPPSPGRWRGGSGDGGTPAATYASNDSRTGWRRNDSQGDASPRSGSRERWAGNNGDRPERTGSSGSRGSWWSSRSDSSSSSSPSHSGSGSSYSSSGSYSSSSSYSSGSSSSGSSYSSSSSSSGSSSYSGSSGGSSVGTTETTGGRHQH